MSYFFKNLILFIDAGAIPKLRANIQQVFTFTSNKLKLFLIVFITFAH